jgi:hypothetical protein
MHGKVGFPFYVMTRFDRFMRRMVKPLERRKENFIILPTHPPIHYLLKHLEFFSVDTIEKSKNCPKKEMESTAPDIENLYTLSIERIETKLIPSARCQQVTYAINSAARLPVPKMVKNGFNSVFRFFCQFKKDGSSKEIKSRYEAESCPKNSKKRM